jgi:hypothetical protein
MLIIVLYLLSQILFKLSLSRSQVGFRKYMLGVEPVS